MNNFSEIITQLSPAKQQLLKQKIEEGMTGVYPVSYAQQRLWFLATLDPLDTSYNMPSAVRITGNLSIENLKDCLNALMQRHESLRTVFNSVAGMPVQIIHNSINKYFYYYNLKDIPGESREKAAAEIVKREIDKPFDIKIGPLLKPFLFR